MAKYNDPLDQKGFGADFWGNHSQKLEYDPTYGRNVYTAGYALVGIILALVGYFTGFKTLYYYAAGAGVVALLYFLFYKTYKGYDIASSRVYCEKLYPPGTPKSKIRECLYEREREERLGGSRGNGVLGGLAFASILSNN